MATASRLNQTLKDFILSQNLFFVATAAPDGRVNLSPKGMDSLRILDDQTILWLNLSGSGNETASHLLESPRMTMMFCAFDGNARILRTYGTAKTFHPADKDWDDLIKSFPQMAGSRQIFRMTIDLVQTSCGTGVPIMEFKEQRGYEELLPFYQEMGPDGVKAYWQKKNKINLDGKKTGI